jgi:hypothetical protein
MKIRPVGAELFHVAGQTEGQDDAKGGFSEFCGRASKLLFRRHLKITRNNSVPLTQAMKPWITNFKG